jgi:hypothetical protein
MSMPTDGLHTLTTSPSWVGDEGESNSEEHLVHG